MNVIQVEQVVVPLLPLYFLIRYLIMVRARRRTIESWWLIGSNAAFSLLLLIGASTAIFGTSWTGREVVREVSYAVTGLVFGAQVVWLEYRLRRDTVQAPPDPGPTGADKTLWEDTR